MRVSRARGMLCSPSRTTWSRHRSVTGSPSRSAAVWPSRLEERPSITSWPSTATRVGWSKSTSTPRPSVRPRCNIGSIPSASHTCCPPTIRCWVAHRARSTSGAASPPSSSTGSRSRRWPPTWLPPWPRRASSAASAWTSCRFPQPPDGITTPSRSTSAREARPFPTSCWSS